jgi:two-component system nitrate/nitrite response regulator NarL
MRETQMLVAFTSVPRFIVMDRSDGDDRALIRIILADSQAVYRVGIQQVLTSETDMGVVAQADTLAGAHWAVERFFIRSRTQRAYTSAIMLLEGNMISARSDVVSELVCRAPQLKIIVQSAQMDEFNTVELYRRGVSGIIPRSISPDLLVKCVRKIAAGETWIDSRSLNWVIKTYRSEATALASPRSPSRLSPKEMAIITCITQGKRNKEIAYEFGLTEQKVKNYLRNIYDKLGVSDRLELTIYGFNHQLHNRGYDSRFLPIASVHGPDIQSKPNAVCKA